MKPFINCKYESICNVLKQFNKNTTLLNNIYHFELKNENDVLVARPKSKIDFEKILKIFKIQEVTVDRTNDLKQFLIDKLSIYKCIVIKVDLYYQKFSEKYYQKRHKKHNVFIKEIHNNVAIIIENEFADSENYIEIAIELEELKKWYLGYLINYYNTGIDKADTIYLYKRNYEDYLESKDYYKVFDSLYCLKIEKQNLSKFINYFNNTYESKNELKTYINILNYKLKYLNKIKDTDSSSIEKILLDEINILHKLQKDIFRENRTENNKKKLIELWNKEIEYLEKYEKTHNIILRKDDKYKIIKDISYIETINKDIDDLYIQRQNVIMNIQKQNHLKGFRNIIDIGFKTLSKCVCVKYREYNYLLNIQKENLIISLKNEGYTARYINIQRNSINGYTDADGKEKYFFKILKNDSAFQELKGYFCLMGKLNVSEIREIIKYKNYSIIIFIYDESIQENNGLLNDFFVENDNQYKIEKEHYEIIEKIINENLKYVNHSILRKRYPMQSFFYERITTRLKVWYTENFKIKFNNKKYSILEIVKDVEKYFEKKRLLPCFLSQGDPNALNIGIKPIMFDYTTSGYNPLIAEFCTMMWSILFNDLYFAPKYHANSYYNHTKILEDYGKYKLDLDYYISENTIDIIDGKIKTTRIRKTFMIEYIKKIKNIVDDRSSINKDCINFFIMRILCVFNLNEMEEKDKIYALFIMVTLIDNIKKSKDKDTLNIIENFILDLEEF